MKDFLYGFLNKALDLVKENPVYVMGVLVIGVSIIVYIN